MLADVGLHGLESGALAAAGKYRLGIDRPSGEVVGTPLPNGAVPFEHQAQGIKARMTGGATRVLPVFSKYFPQGQIELGLIVGQFGHCGRRWRYGFAEYALDGPV